MALLLPLWLALKSLWAMLLGVSVDFLWNHPRLLGHCPLPAPP